MVCSHDNTIGAEVVRQMRLRASLRPRKIRREDSMDLPRPSINQSISLFQLCHVSTPLCPFLYTGGKTLLAESAVVG